MITSQLQNTPKAASEANPSNRFQKALLNLFTRKAVVATVTTIGKRFRLITIEGEALKGADWRPGQKIQVVLTSLVSRTYTPLDWDNNTGSTRFLAFIHGNGPGATWANSLQGGETCHVFGPRPSLHLQDTPRPAVFFGDETSFGAAHTLKATPQGLQGMNFVFEVSSIAESQPVLDTLDIPNARLVERKADDAHFEELALRLLEMADTFHPERFILTGKASAILRVNRALKQRGVDKTRFTTKAYWAPGKSGLD